MSEIGTITLEQIYRRYLNALEKNKPLPDGETINAIELRARLATPILQLNAINLSEYDLDEFVARLSNCIAPNPDIDRAQDFAEREIARVQMGVFSDEARRRYEYLRDVEKGRRFAPVRSRLIGQVIMLAETVRHGSPDSTEYKFIEQLRNLIISFQKRYEPGATTVAEILRHVTLLPKPYTDQDPAERWVMWATALDILTSEFGFGGFEPLKIEPLTWAQAQRAKRILFAFDRQDYRYDEEDLPLDVEGDLLAQVLEGSTSAYREWHRYHLPHADLVAYTTPLRREEAGRPQPSVYIRPEREARELAQKAGGVLLPMLYPLAPTLRRRAAKIIWSEGIPPVPPNELGWAVYGVPGDMRVQWGAFPHPDGLLVTVCISPQNILTIGRGDQDLEHEKTLQRLVEEAQRRSEDTENYRGMLRQLLLQEGYYAIARYDYLYRETPTPQELIVLDPTPQHLCVIRESVPSFVFVPDYKRIQTPSKRVILP